MCVTVDSVVGPRCVFSVHLRISTDALFVDSVVGVSQQDVGETGLQQVHSQEGGLLHNLKQKGQDCQTTEILILFFLLLRAPSPLTSPARFS